MVGDDDMMGETGGRALQPLQQADTVRFLPLVELARVEFGDDVMNV